SPAARLRVHIPSRPGARVPDLIARSSLRSEGNMAKRKILCVHGIGDHHSNLAWEEEWKSAIEGGLRRWSPDIECEFSFLLHDDIFARYPISAMDVAEAVVKLGASGVVHSIGDAITSLFSRRRGFVEDVSSSVRWTAGMVVQWAEN